MNAVYLILLLILIALSAGILYHLRQFARRTAQPAVVDEAVIRRAVSQALAADREREIIEARAFWAEQEARAAEDGPLFDPPFTPVSEEWPLFFPRPTGPAEAADAADGMSSLDPVFGEALRSALEGLMDEEEGRPGHPTVTAGHATDAAGELLATGLEAGLLDATAPKAAPDLRRHPSHPDFIPAQRPSHEWTDTRLSVLADDGVALTDVRPGPLGTLDVYAFANGTTLCVAPGDREAAYRLIDAVRGGEDVRLLGGSRFAGSYSLTFSTGDEPVYVLADRVVASI